MLRPRGGLPVRSVFGIALVMATLGGALVALGGRPPGRADAATTTCAQHTRRVVGQVKRHGKTHRVTRLKHYRTCQEASAPSTLPAEVTAASIAPAPSPVSAPAASEQSLPSAPILAPPAIEKPPVAEPEPEANAIGVAAEDHERHFKYTLSRQTVKAGKLTVQLQNKGEDPHDMEMERIGPDGEPLGEPVEVPVTAPGEQKTASVDVEPGRYRMWCNLYHHAEEGMEATITVE